MTAEAMHDAELYGSAFLEVDASIRLHHKLGVTEPWNEWEWPRRLAAIALTEPTQLTLEV